MHAVTNVLFTDEECEVFLRASYSVRVGFPGATPEKMHQDLPRPCDDAQAERIVNRLSQYGDPVSAEYLARAIAVFDLLLVVCMREAEESYWHRLLEGREPTPSTLRMIEVLVGARRQFVEDLGPALDLLHQAASLATSLPERDKWSDDLDLVDERVAAVMAEEA